MERVNSSSFKVLSPKEHDSSMKKRPSSHNLFLLFYLFYCLFYSYSSDTFLSLTSLPLKIISPQQTLYPDDALKFLQEQIPQFTPPYSPLMVTTSSEIAIKRELTTQTTSSPPRSTLYSSKGCFLRIHHLLNRRVRGSIPHNPPQFINFSLDEDPHKVPYTLFQTSSIFILSTSFISPMRFGTFHVITLNPLLLPTPSLPFTENEKNVNRRIFLSTSIHPQMKLWKIFLHQLYPIEYSEDDSQDSLQIKFSSLVESTGNEESLDSESSSTSSPLHSQQNLQSTFNENSSHLNQFEEYDDLNKAF